jgi:anti-sigma factor RsiW
MTDTTRDQVCESANDLVGFLYGELTDWEARKFERHMQDCAACRTEYAVFGQLRESVVAWRDESLGLAGAPVLAPTALPPAQQRRPAARLAIREFFSLSPLWLKGAAAFAAVLFCILATLAVTDFAGKKNAPQLVSSDKIYTEQQLNAAVDRSVREKTALLEARLNSNPTAGDDGLLKQTTAKRPVRNETTEVASTTQKLRRPLSRRERQELAADLRLLSARDDDGLDLVGDSINQKP